MGDVLCGSPWYWSGCGSVGKFIFMHVLALDTSGVPFPADQLKLVKLEIQVDNKGILDVLPDVKQPDKMRVTGLTLGTASITLTTTTQKGRVGVLTLNLSMFFLLLP